MMTTGQLVSEIGRHQPAELALLLGAGASKSSGVSLASEMIDEWRQDLFEASVPSDARAGVTAKEWLKSNQAAYPWFDDDTEYSKLFERRYRTPSRRQKYIEQKIEGVRPGWGYLYLANIIVSARRFTTVFTTNFDDLINEALGSFLRHNAVVCNADSEVDQISFLSDRAKIVKLHGDYLFADIRNTEAELRGKRMAAKFGELARQRGLVVVGYAGRDQSVMSMIETLLGDPNSFPHSIYWGLRRGEAPSKWVTKLSVQHAERFELFECHDFDAFMADIHARLKLELPDSILSPRITLEGELAELVAKAVDNRTHALIREHSARLQAQLGRPVEAELALSRRDYRRAIELVQRHIAKQGRLGPALTVWGSALAIQAEEEGRDDLVREAVAMLTEAIEKEPDALPQRYGLASLLSRRRMSREAIAACEWLRDRVPNDAGVRRALVELYRQASQFGAAERELAWLDEREPRAVDIPAMQGMILISRGYMPQAADRFREAVKRDPTNPYLHFQLAQAVGNMRQFDEAEHALQQAAKLAPDNVMILMALAEFYCVVRQRVTDALALLEKAVRIDPNSAEARGKLGEVYLYQNRPADAERETAAAVELLPDDARLVGNLGIILLQLNREAEAEPLLERSRNLNPSLPQPRYMLCLLYATQDRVGDFNSELQGLARLTPQMVQPVQMQAQALRAQGMQMRAQGLPFPWQQVMHTLFGWQSGQPQMQHSPQASHPPSGWEFGGYAAGPGGISGLEQAGDTLKSWWQKLTS
jgi:tetratricopeptide (TPR) repeat protein